MSRNSEEDLNVIRAICVALGVPVFKYLFNLYSWNLLGFIILICAIIILVVFIREKISQSNILDDNPQSQESFPNNQDTNKSSSINASSQNIQWTEIGTYYSNTSQTNEKNYNADIEPDFLSGGNVNVTIEELLTNLIGQKDRVTGEVFSQGETVYFCVPCQLGYHEDSWQFLNQKCEQCGSDSITRYTLTTKYDEYINQGNACYNLGNNQAAIDNYNQAIRINPNFADIYNRRGAAHYTLGNNQAAIEDYNQAIRLNPNFAEAYNSRGVAHYKLGNNQAAIEDYNQAIRLNPNFAEAYNSRGVAHYKLGNNQAAIEDYNQAIRLNPNFTEAKTNLDITRSKLEKIQQPKVSRSINSETSTITEVYQEYIDVLNLGAIHKKIDHIVTVKGRVASVNVDNNNNIIYFNFAENTYQGFYAYVPTSSGHKFPHPTKYSGKTVIISGKISLNRNMRPRMALKNSSQLKDAE